MTGFHEKIKPGKRGLSWKVRFY